MRSFISKSFPVPGNNTKIPLFYKRYIELRTKKLTTIFQDLTKRRGRPPNTLYSTGDYSSNRH